MLEVLHGKYISSELEVTKKIFMFNVTEFT